MSFSVSEEILADVEHPIQYFEHNKDTFGDFATRVDETEAKLKTFIEYACFVEGSLCEQRNQLPEKDASSGEYRELVVGLE